MDGYKHQHHTLFGVVLESTKSMKPYYARDFIMRWTSDDLENSKLAIDMVNNEMLPTTKEEAVDAVGLKPLFSEFNAVQIRAKTNPNITVHLVHTDFYLHDEDVEMLINNANHSKFGRKELVKSKIRF